MACRLSSAPLRHHIGGNTRRTRRDHGPRNLAARLHLAHRHHCGMARKARWGSGRAHGYDCCSRLGNERSFCYAVKMRGYDKIPSMDMTLERCSVQSFFLPGAWARARIRRLARRRLWAVLAGACCRDSAGARRVGLEC